MHRHKLSMVGKLTLAAAIHSTVVVYSKIERLCTHLGCLKKSFFANYDAAAENYIRPVAAAIAFHNNLFSRVYSLGADEAGGQSEKAKKAAKSNAACKNLQS